MTDAWWRHHFDEDYYRLHAPLFTEEESRGQVAAMLELLGLHAGARVLDMPCGWGRHTVLLRQAGIDAVGADLSPALLRRARDAADPAAGGTWCTADLRALPFADDAFDAVINVYTSLGLFLDDDEDLRALREVRRVLRGDGRFLLESMHRDDVVAGYAERDAWELPDGTRVRVRRRFDPVTGISHERLRWRRGEAEGEKRHALRLRTATEIDRLLRAAGLEPDAYYGGWDGRPLRHDSPRMIIVARSRAAEAPWCP